MTQTLERPIAVTTPRPRNDWDSPRLQACLREYQQSWDSGQAVAAKYGVPYHTMVCIATRRGLTRRRPGYKWPRERVIVVLRQVAEALPRRLPSASEAYNAIRNHRKDWPDANVILRCFGSLNKAWRAIGVDPQRFALHWCAWTEEENDYLLDHAGIETFEQMATHLQRSRAAVKNQLNRILGVKARENQGYLSASALAREYGCSVHRVYQLLAAGRIAGTYNKRRHMWHVDPSDLTPEVQALLRRAKTTHKASAPDLGDYEQRYGLMRKRIAGKVVRVRASAIEEEPSHVHP